jgi:molybdate transport system ATP-binding protein
MNDLPLSEPRTPALWAEAVLSRRNGFLLYVELALPRGVTVLLGPSGAGKSSTLDILAGHLVPDFGRIELDGVPLLVRQDGAPPQVNVPARRRRIGYVMQSSMLFPHLNVHDNLAYGLFGWREPEREARIVELADALGVTPLLSRWPLGLSGGERQRIALARALCPRPRALLLDEPLSAVDLVQRQALLSSLAALLSRLDIPVLYVTHSVEEQQFFAAAQRCQTLRLQPRPDGKGTEIALSAEGA